MTAKTSSLCSLSTTTLVIVLLCLSEYVQISNGYAYCQYYRRNHPWPFLKACPFICCPLTPITRENTTCCDPPTEPTPLAPTTVTIFGYRWWTVFLCVLCILLALTLLVQVNKHFHIIKHWKHFNSVVNPATTFVVPTTDSTNYQTPKYSVKDDMIVLEQQPPLYADAASSMQPPYASFNPTRKTDLE